MTEISRDNDGPSPSDTPPMEGTQVADASSTSSTREAINLLSTAMAQRRRCHNYERSRTISTPLFPNSKTFPKLSTTRPYTPTAVSHHHQ